MIRINLAYFYRLGISFDALDRLEVEVPHSQVWWPLYNAQNEVRNLFANTDLTSAFRATAIPARILLDSLEKATSQNLESLFSQYDKAVILGALSQFQAVLTGELAVSDAYFVVEKKGFNSLKLISQGEVLFPTGIETKVPESVPDLREAGKCIAFELPMAAAFHIFRAVESVLRRYWAAINGNVKPLKQHNIGAYLREFKSKNCGDAKVVQALEQMNVLHRNPIIHPQDKIDLDDAISLLGIAQSVVSAMLKYLPEVQSETTPPDEQTFPLATPSN